jgi:peptidoglycan/xylan/chitin deacetylase (PgdA/CDA1 family)
MKWLVRRGYRTISFEELLRLRRGNVLPPARSIVVTFDDGYVDNTALAAPVLERLGIPVTIFLVSGTDGRSSWNVRDSLARRRLLTLPAATKVRSRLLGFGAHTRTHPRLTEVDATALESEVAGSKRDLEEAFGEEVVGFAYPYGKHDERVRAEVARAGFLGACTVEEGRNRPATDDYRLRRVEIYGTDSFLRFVLSVWLGWAERPFARRKGRQ